MLDSSGSGILEESTEIKEQANEAFKFTMGDLQRDTTLQQFTKTQIQN